MCIQRLSFTLCIFALTAFPMGATSYTDGLKDDITTESSYRTIIREIEEASTEEILFHKVRALKDIDISQIENPFDLLVELSELTSLRGASLAIKTYFSYQLYRLTIKVFHAQIEKKKWVTPESKKEIIEQLGKLCSESNSDINSDIIHNIDCITTFIKALPENDIGKRQEEIAYQLIKMLLSIDDITTKQLEKVLQAQLSMTPQQPTTYLLLLEVLKIYYIKKPGQEAFSMLKTLLERDDLPVVVRYQIQQVVGELLRTLVSKDNQYEAYAYMDQLLPLLPTLLSPLEDLDNFEKGDISLLCKGLMIQWCLTRSHLETLLNIKDASDKQSYIEAKINEKEMEAWLTKFKKKLTDLGLLSSAQEKQHSLQVIIGYAVYFKTINLLLIENKEDFLWQIPIEKEVVEKPIAQEVENEGIKELAASVSNITAQTEGLHQTIKEIQERQQEQQKILQIIKKNTKAPPQVEKNKELLFSSPWLYPPYIWGITLALLLLVLLFLMLLFRSLKRKRI